MLHTGARHATTEFRSAARIGERRIDGCFTDLERDADGLARAELCFEGSTVSLWLDAAFKYLQGFTGDTLAPERRRRGVAIEPMTCPPRGCRASTSFD
jgi:aldose 1-epimerase